MSIDYALSAHIVTITINRPEARNSLDMEHFRDLAHAWVRFRDDGDARVAVVTGVGQDFCTGADLKKFIPEVTGELPRPEGWDKVDAVHAVLHRLPVYKPIIAAVNGTCLAGGFEMLTCTDIRVAVPEARFAVIEPKRGLALTMGLINRVVPRERLLETAYDYAGRIAANAPLAVSATKQSAVEGLALDLDTAYDNETRHSDRIFATEDAKEGPRAFAQKRPPRWQAR